MDSSVKAWVYALKGKEVTEGRAVKLNPTQQVECRLTSKHFEKYSKNMIFRQSTL